MRKIIILSFLFLPFLAHAQSDCVLGLVNDPAPGSCGSYVDRDGNDLCDLSEIDIADNVYTSEKNEQGQVPEEELKRYSVAQVAGLYGIQTNIFTKELSDFLGVEVVGGDSMQVLHDRNGLCAGVAATIATSLQGSGGGVAAVAATNPNSLIAGSDVKSMKIYELAELYNVSEEELANQIAGELGIKVKQGESIGFLHDNYGLEASKVKEIAGNLAQNSIDFGGETQTATTLAIVPRYRFVAIVFTTLFLYLITFILALQKKITILILRRIWNSLLLLTFLGSTFLGVLLIIRINYGWYINLPFNMLYWHVELGTAMATITTIHISWYWRFYTSMLRRRKS